MTSIARTASFLVLTIFLAVPGFAGTASPERSGAAARLATLLDYNVSLCNTNCELGGCSRGKHSNELRMEEGNDGGKAHGSCEPGHCAETKGEHVHKCESSSMAQLLSPEALEDMLDLIPRIPTQELLAMDRVEPNLLFNGNRRAVQVLGCNGLVLASVELTAAQAIAFDLLLD